MISRVTVTPRSNGRVIGLGLGKVAFVGAGVLFMLSGVAVAGPEGAQIAKGNASITRNGPNTVIRADNNAIIASAEYRFHLPRVLGVSPDASNLSLFGRPFHVARPQRFGRPDWDLIFRGFVDAARVVNNDRLSFESDDTLIGTGVGVELQVLRNFNARVDWGVALEDANNGAVTSGSNRFHISFTALF